MLHAQLDGQFLGDAILAPSGLVGADAVDEGDMLSGNARPPRLAGLPAPVPPESSSVPVDHRCWLHERQRRAPALPNPGKGDPERSLFRLQSRPLLGAGIGSELLAEGQVLNGKRATRCDDGAEEPDKQGDEEAHGIAILLQPEMASIL